ncbi:unnamed protein product [Cuscuta europaea]|uniref:Uncharacterized protein n=1 Tax=Cuscuta europaea TaxID=41803 RepID=A0A9P0YY17_CUSEU|nr:unnamed protein product [Cuscuta europaea]
MKRLNGCAEKLPSRRGFWGYDYEEDTQKTVSRNKTGNWTPISKKTTGMVKVEKSCRPRWSNRQKHDIDLQDGNFTTQEEELIVKLHATIGSRWTIIAQQVPGRTETEVKNVWNAKLKKKLTAMGIDPVTHKPFSQILTDFGNIGAGFPPSSPHSFSSGRRSFGSLTNPPTAHRAETPPEDIRGGGDPFHPSKNSDDHHHRHTADLFAELQAIKSITNNNYSVVEAPLSSSLSSSSSLTSKTTTVDNHLHQEANNASSSGFSWCDFLLEDAFLPVQQSEWDPPQEPTENRDDVAPPENDRISSSNDDHLEAAASSFMEAMLSREDEMFLDFPGLSEEPFYY